MKKLLLGFILLLIAIGIGYIIQQDPGYVLVYYKQWSLSMSLWIALIALLLLFMIIHYALKVMHHIFLFKSNLGHWSSVRKHKKALNHIDQGVCHILNENWAAATATFNQSKQNSPNPLINAYFSIIASHHKGNTQQRDDHLKEVMALSDNYKVPALLLKAQLQINEEQWHKALNTLDYLYQEAPKNAAVLQKLLSVLTHLNEWERLKGLLPKIEKYTSLDKKTLRPLYEDLYCSYLTEHHENKHLEQLNLHWKSIPSAYQKTPRVFRAYITALIAHHESEQALTLIEKALPKQWDQQLIIYYGEIPSTQTTQRLLKAEKWLSQHANDPDLLLCLARLCLREKIWGKAEEYLQQSYSLRPTRQALLELSQLSELTGHQQQALSYLKDSLKIQ